VVTNTKWTLTDQVSGSKTPTLNIEDKRISGNGGCNNFFAEATVDANNGTFLVGNVGSTRMACNDLKTEQNFFNLLEQANKYTVKDGYLELYKDNLLLLRFRK
jgi:heat shock protein HslJ